RINAVLAGVRGFLAFAVDQGEAPQQVMRQLYELAGRLRARPAAGGDLSGLRPGFRGDALRRRHAEPADDRYHAQCRPSRRGAALAHLALPGRGGGTGRLVTPMATWLGAPGAGHGGRLVRKGSPTM